MTVKEKVKSHPGVVDYFKEIPLYNKDIEKILKNTSQTEKLNLLQFI